MSLDYNVESVRVLNDKIKNLELTLMQSESSTLHWKNKYLEAKSALIATEEGHAKVQNRIEELLGERARDLEIRSALIRELVELRKVVEANKNGI